MVRKAKHATDEICAEEKLDALHLVLQSVEFRNSPRLASFLTYIVNEEMAGRQARLKALAIAIEVYGRNIDFDPQSNALVRVEAGRLRKALEIFYAKARPTVPIEILVPRGGYVPQYRRSDDWGSDARQANMSPTDHSEGGPGETPKRYGEPSDQHLFMSRLMRVPWIMHTTQPLNGNHQGEGPSRERDAAGVNGEAGRKAGRMGRSAGSEPTYADTGYFEPKRLQSLEEENAKLKRLLADAILDNSTLKDLLQKKW